MPVSIAATAKLNLGLEVLGRLPNGYHEVKTVLQTISIVDHVTVAESDSFEIVAPGLEVSSDENLALQAAQLVTEKLGTPPVRIELKKSIPAAAGLGGASSDAASTMRAIRALWRSRIPLDTLSGLAARLGSDVPFFLTGGTALATGRGVDLTWLPPLPLVWFVVAVPHIPLSNKTATMYGRLSLADFSDGSAVEAVAATVAGGNTPNWSRIPNAFMRPLLEWQPHLSALGDAFNRAGAPFVAISGAGPAHFCAVPDRRSADEIRAAIAEYYEDPLRLFVCSPLPASPEPIVTIES